MTSARAIATSVVVGAVALALIAKGVDLLRFEAAEASARAILSSEPGNDATGREARRLAIEQAIPAVAAWTATPGLAGRSRLTKGLMVEAAAAPPPSNRSLAKPWR